MWNVSFFSYFFCIRLLAHLNEVLNYFLYENVHFTAHIKIRQEGEEDEMPLLKDDETQWVHV